MNEEPNTDEPEMDMPADDFIDTNWQIDQPWMNDDAYDSIMSADDSVTDEPELEPTEDQWNDVDFDSVLYGSEVDAEFDDAEAWIDSIDNMDLDDPNTWTGDISIDEPEVCVNTDNGITDDYGDDCDAYAENLAWCGNWDSEANGFYSMDMCCACKENGEGVYVNPNYDPDTCEDNMDVVDVFDDSCAEYWGNEDWCGVYDYTYDWADGYFTPFNSWVDCCACRALTGDEL